MSARSILQDILPSVTDTETREGLTEEARHNIALGIMNAVNFSNLDMESRLKSLAAEHGLPVE